MSIYEGQAGETSVIASIAHDDTYDLTDKKSFHSKISTICLSIWTTTLRNIYHQQLQKLLNILFDIPLTELYSVVCSVRIASKR